MLAVTVSLEDVSISAIRDVTPGKWDVIIRDIVTKKMYQAVWTDTQIASVMALSLGGDNLQFPEEVKMTIIDQLYAIADKAIAGCPSECRPIP
jgi:predicted transcriptional regulator